MTIVDGMEGSRQGWKTMSKCSLRAAAEGAAFTSDGMVSSA